MQATADNILNVTLLEPRQKHPTIFARFDELAEGESLTIHNDHDPKPLYYQLLGERGDTFIWEYQAQGPEWWIVKIAKRVNGDKDETLGELAAKDYRKAQVFKKYGLDFCCGGKKSVKAACEEKGIDADKVERELNALTEVPAQKTDNYDIWGLGFLGDYIVNKHHSYVRQAIPALSEYTSKIAR